MGSVSVVEVVAVAILAGATLHDEGATVGPFAVVGVEPGARFACVDWDGDRASLMSPRCTSEDGEHAITQHEDWSAFAAARCFVQLVGWYRADLALKAAARRARGAV